MLARYVRAFGLSAVLHVLVAAVLVWLMRPGSHTRTNERTITVVVEAAAEDAAYPGLNPVDREKEDWDLKTDSGGSLAPLALGDLDVDVDKIAERAPVLFPFVTPGFLLEHFFPQLRDRYARELSRIGLTTGAALDEHYDAVRLAILTGIVGTSPNGYGANDARFLIGAIHWRAQRTDDALRWWRRLTANPDGSYAIASPQIQLALRAAEMERAEDGSNVDDPLRREIDRILKNERGRWLSFSFDRLKQFGYRFDTY